MRKIGMAERRSVAKRNQNSAKMSLSRKTLSPLSTTRPPTPSTQIFDDERAATPPISTPYEEVEPIGMEPCNNGSGVHGESLAIDPSSLPLAMVEDGLASDGDISTAEKQGLANSFNFSAFAKIARRVLGKKDDESLWALTDISIQWVRQVENLKPVSLDSPIEMEYLNDEVIRGELIEEWEVGEEKEDELELLDRKEPVVEDGELTEEDNTLLMTKEVKSSEEVKSPMEEVVAPTKLTVEKGCDAGKVEGCGGPNLAEIMGGRADYMLTKEEETKNFQKNGRCVENRSSRPPLWTPNAETKGDGADLVLNKDEEKKLFQHTKTCVENDGGGLSYCEKIRPICQNIDLKKEEKRVRGMKIQKGGDIINELVSENDSIGEGEANFAEIMGDRADCMFIEEETKNFEKRR